MILRRKSWNIIPSVDFVIVKMYSTVIIVKTNVDYDMVVIKKCLLQIILPLSTYV